jgi:glyoxylase-like metal-dependent hydrolase (beta-lactamase superfamily II)/ferredoxin
VLQAVGLGLIQYGGDLANPRLAYPANAPGEFFVDRRCIDCDNCRSLAPQIFVQRLPIDDGDDGYAYVQRQPVNAAERRQAIAALAVCPVQCIGSRVGVRRAQATASFPMLLEEPVYFLGQTSQKSYGGKAYVALLPFANVLFDAPRWDRHLRAWLEARGGVDFIFLSHRDDVADAPRYADYFGADVFIGDADADAYRGPRRHALTARRPVGFGEYLAARPVAGLSPSPELNRLLLLPTPGHTAGHYCFRLDERFLFTGDHVAVNRCTGRLYAFRYHCWHDWHELLASVRLLQDYPCEWLLPAHGRYGRFPWSEMRAMLAAVAVDGAA